jgi:hypothetical protein
MNSNPSSWKVADISVMLTIFEFSKMCGIKRRGLLGFAVEPQERGDFLHRVAPL